MVVSLKTGKTHLCVCNASLNLHFNAKSILMAIIVYWHDEWSFTSDVFNEILRATYRANFRIRRIELTKLLVTFEYFNALNACPLRPVPAKLGHLHKNYLWITNKGLFTARDYVPQRSVVKWHDTFENNSELDSCAKMIISLHRWS